MASKITLKNLEQTEFSITHPDGIGAGTIKSTDITYKIDSVDDFASVPSAFDTVIVKDKDRGGVFNKITSTTANDGTIFDGTGCSWERQYSGAVNAKWFGYRADNNSASGATNVTALQAAIDYSDTFTLKPPVVIPAGSGYINALVTVNANCTLIGESSGAPSGHTPSGLVVDHSANGLDIGNNVVLKDFTLSKSVAQYGTGIGLNSGYEGATRGQGKDVFISGLKIMYFDTGIYLNRWNNFIQNTRVYKPNTVGIKLAGPCNNNILDTVHVFGEKPAGGYAIGISIEDTLGADPYVGSGMNSHIVISNSHIEPSNIAIKIEQGKNIVIENNYFEITTNAFILVEGLGTTADDETSVNIKNNYFSAYSADADTRNYVGIRAGAGRVTIDDNHIDAYNPVTNVGLTYGISYGELSRMRGVLIGRNYVNAWEPIARADYAYRKIIKSRWNHSGSIEIQPATGVNVNNFAFIPKSYGNDSKYRFSKLEASCYNSTTVGTFGQIVVGKRDATGQDLYYFVNNWTPALVAGNVYEPADITEWQSAGAKYLEDAVNGGCVTLRVENGTANNGLFHLNYCIEEYRIGTRY